MTFGLPRALTLPSGDRVTLRLKARERDDDDDDDDDDDARRLPRSGPFAEAFAVFDDVVEIARRAAIVDVRDLPLADFHVLRACLIKAGLVSEPSVEITCRNCERLLSVRPCERLETGPWEHAEADDPELDRTAPFDEPLEITPVPVGRIRSATSVTLSPVIVGDALSFLAEDDAHAVAANVRAMGLKALGPITDPDRIATILASSAGARASVAAAYVEAHYPLRLGADVFCPRCRARNTVDAPAARELGPGSRWDRDDGPAPAGAKDEDAAAIPSVEVFVERTHAIADELLATIPGERVDVVVDDGIPEVDDGGEPLLGAYVPPPAADAPVPTRPPTVTIYFKTFRRMEEEEGHFDWEGELRETLAHEIEHHLFWQKGHDPMDEEEHAEIDREVLRVIGRGEVTRRALGGFGLSLVDFWKRGWLFVLLALAAFAIAYAEGRCNPTSID